MEAVLDLITVLIFVFVLCAFFGVRGLSKRRRREEMAAKRLAALLPQGEGEIEENIGSIIQEMETIAFSKVPVLGPRIEQLWLAINTLGWRQSLKMRLAMMVLGGVFFGVIIGLKTPAPLIFAPLIAIIASISLFFVMMQKALARQFKELRTNLPEAIDALNRTCRAGVPVTNAFVLVAQHLNGPIATEFRIVDHWLKLGVPLRQVLKNSARRIPLAEYRFFVVILIINQESGGRLGETLERLSKTLRDREELKLKILAKTSEARASAKIVAALVPFMMAYMYFNAPNDFLFLLNDPTGNKVLIYIVASVLSGLFIIHLLVKRVR
ncbi:type II secretion system F family protein [Terasakiella pusilla]|uniref:type II secretion system F family protein n=1 Tax=Terasakiella pusilla TaxID=64973 RepID=UPI003AA997E7